MPSLPHALLAASLFLSLACAQAPSRWADLTVPGGVNFTGLQSSANLVVYRIGSYLRVFSAATGRWDPMPVSSGTTPVLRADILIVPENDRFTAYSAYSGASVPVFASFANSTLTAMDSVAVVQEGALLHTFSAFTGTWVTRTLPAGWQLSVGPLMAVIGDTVNTPCSGASVFDVYTGQWHDLPAQPSALRGGLVFSGSAALLDFTTHQMGWTSHRPSWVGNPATPGAAHASAGNYGDSDLVINQGTVFGPDGTFQPSPLVPPQTNWHRPEGLTASVALSNQAWAAGVRTSGWTALPAGAAPIGYTGGAVSLYSLGNQILAFNGLTGTTSATNTVFGGYQTLRGKGVMAVVTDLNTRRAALFSALTDQWYSPPAGTPAGMPPLVGRSGLVLRGPTALMGFSCYSGAFVPLSATAQPISSIWGGTVLAATSSNALYAFDPRMGQWSSAPLASTPDIEARGEMMIATDGSRAIGFCERSGRLDSIALPEPVLDSWAETHVGVVRTQNHLLAFAGLPETLTWSSLPGGNATVVTGSVSRQQLSLPPQHIGVMGISPRPAASLLVPPFGQLWLDPAATSTFFLMGSAAQPRGLVEIQVPDLPSLRGSEWWLQSLILPQSGQAWLSDPAVLRVL